MITVVDVLKTIADGKSLVLFNTIAVSNCDSDLLKSKVALTRKQYYSRLSAFINAGIVKRERGKYSLTTFGKVLHYAQEIIGKAVNEYWQLKAIDSIRASGNEVPQEQFHRIIDTLIIDQQMKDILV